MRNIFNVIYICHSIERLKIELGKEMLLNKKIIIEQLIKLKKKECNNKVNTNMIKNDEIITHGIKKSISNSHKYHSTKNLPVIYLIYSFILPDLFYSFLFNIFIFKIFFFLFNIFFYFFY